MPYIPTEDRDRVLETGNITTKGELNFVLSTIMYEYLAQNGTNYQNISDVIAAALDAGEEFRRRVMNPYEDTKIIENGDIV